MTKKAQAKATAPNQAKVKPGRLTSAANAAKRVALGNTGATEAVKSGRKKVSGEAALPLAVSPLSLLIPTPPSIDRAFGNQAGRGRGRYPTVAYKNWQASALWRIAQQSPTHFAGPCVVLASVGRTSLSADIDNRAKLLLDVLTVAGVYPDDSMATAIALVWSPLEVTRPDEETRVLILSAETSFKIEFQPIGAGRVGGWFLEEEDEDNGN